MRDWTVKEQVIVDSMTGLTIQFEVMPDGEPRLRLFGKSLPYGNREIHFFPKGSNAGAGTTVGSLCRPSRLTEI